MNEPLPDTPLITAFAHWLQAWTAYVQAQATAAAGAPALDTAARQPATWAVDDLTWTDGSPSTAAPVQIADEPVMAREPVEPAVGEPVEPPAHWLALTASPGPPAHWLALLAAADGEPLGTPGTATAAAQPPVPPDPLATWLGALQEGVALLQQGTIPPAPTVVPIGAPAALGAEDTVVPTRECLTKATTADELVTADEPVEPPVGEPVESPPPGHAPDQRYTIPLSPSQAANRVPSSVVQRKAAPTATATVIPLPIRAEQTQRADGESTQSVPTRATPNTRRQAYATAVGMEWLPSGSDPAAAGQPVVQVVSAPPLVPLPAPASPFEGGARPRQERQPRANTHTVPPVVEKPRGAPVAQVHTDPTGMTGPAATIAPTPVPVPPPVAPTRAKPLPLPIQAVSPSATSTAQQPTTPPMGTSRRVAETTVPPPSWGRLGGGKNATPQSPAARPLATQAASPAPMARPPVHQEAASHAVPPRDLWPALPPSPPPAVNPRRWRDPVRRQRLDDEQRGQPWNASIS